MTDNNEGYHVFYHALAAVTGDPAQDKLLVTASMQPEHAMTQLYTLAEIAAPLGRGGREIPDGRAGRTRNTE